MADVTIDIELVTKAFNTALKESGDKVKGFEIEVKRTQKGVSTSFKKMGDDAKKTGFKIQGLGGAFNSFIGNLAANATTAAFSAIIGFAKDATKAFIEFEKGLIGVQKTTDITGRDLQKFGKEIQKLSTQIPVASKDLLGIAQTAGQLGVRGSANLLKFTDTVAKLGATTDLVGEAGGTSLIRILNAAGEGVEDIDRLAAAVVDLGNNFAATESEIVGVATEVGRSTAAFKIGSANVVAIATALKSLGVQAQLGGSVVGKSFREIEKAVTGGGKSLETLSKITGLTGKQLQQTFKTDSTAVFKSFVDGLARVSEAGGSVSKALEGFGLKGDEVNKVLPVLAIGADKLSDALERSNKQFREVTALEEEAKKAFSSLDASITKLSNTVSTITTNIGSKFAPALQSTVDAISRSLGAAETNTDKLARLQESLKSFEGRNLGPAGEARKAQLEDQIRLTKALIEEQEKSNFVANEGDLASRLQAFADKRAGKALLKGDKEDPKPDPEEDARVKQELAVQERIRAIREEQALLEEEKKLEKAISEDENVEANLERLAEIERRKAELVFAAEEAKLNALEDSSLKKKQLQELGAKKDLALQKQALTAERAHLQQMQRLQEAAARNRFRLAQAVGDAVLAITGDNQFAALALEKGFAVAQILVNDAKARAGALATSMAIPPPGNAVALAASNAAIASSTSLSLATVAAQTVAKVARFQEGGIVGGSSFTGDNTLARVNSGEMILNRSQQQNLLDVARGRTEFTNDQALTAEQVESIVVSTISNMQVVLQADDTELARSVSRGVENGIIIGAS